MRLFGIFWTMSPATGLEVIHHDITWGRNSRSAKPLCVCVLEYEHGFRVIVRHLLPIHSSIGTLCSSFSLPGHWTKIFQLLNHRPRTSPGSFTHGKDKGQASPSDIFKKEKNYTYCMTTCGLFDFLNSFSLFNVGKSVYSLLSLPS